jgi:succinyl-CoA synthetase beta subunit
MKIHEYQAKEIFRQYGIPTLTGSVATSAEQAEEVARDLSSAVVVLKSQVHIGGRGKGRFLEHGEDGPGGVKVVTDKEAIRGLAGLMLGSTLKTEQGQEKVEILYIEEGCDIASELYAAIVIDRTTCRPVLMASTEGGMDIEYVAANQPEKILKEQLDPNIGLHRYQARRLAYGLGLTGNTAKLAADLFDKLARCFLELDAALAEINPLVITKSGAVIALDGKMDFDENALFRHQRLVEKYNSHGGMEPAEIEAAAEGLSYVKLDGSIGCLVNGAGLAMATMDIIKHEGGSPANFLDVGGGANEQRVTSAFRIILKDPNVKAILINIFGGIVHCDMIAKGVLGAVKAVGLDVPLVVRLEGTNSEQGRKILNESELAIVSATSMQDAAQKVVSALKGSQS